MNEKTQRGGGSRWRQWSHKILWTILILTSMATCHSSPVYLKNSHHLSHYQSGRNIRHLPCKIRRSGEEGICMFAIDCLKSNGTHLGTCIDRFYFGSCCHMKDDQLLVETEISDNSIDENTISHFLHQQTHPTGAATVRPSIEGETPERTERPLVPVSTISATTSHNLSSSSVPPLHHHYTNNYDVISLSSSSPSTPISSSSTPSSVPSSNVSTSSTPLDETRFTSSTTLATTVAIKSDQVSTTTPENVKLSTFQSVEDVTKPPAEEVTTTSTYSTRYPTRRTTTPQTTTSTSTTTVKSTFSPKPKPKPTKRPSSTKKPPVSSTSNRPKPSRRPTTPTPNITSITKKPSRKPTTTTTLAPILPTRKKTTTAAPKTSTTAPKTTTTSTTTKAPETTTKRATTERTTVTTTQSTTTTTSTTPKTTTQPTTTTVKVTPGTDEEEQPLTTLSFVETTKAPRPKPKPTSSIVIVPPTTIASEDPVTQNSTLGVETSVSQSEVPSTASPVENSTKSETTTMSSGLVTWTNIDESEINKTASSTEGWIPLQTIPIETTSEASAVTEAINATTAEVTTASSTTGASGNITEDTSTQTTAGDVTQNVTSETTTPMPSLEGIDYRLICGKRMFPEPRIVGGTKAAFGRWPWQISLRQWRTSTYLHKCGAALLNENWAITAAHCVDNVPPSDLLLRLGEYDLAEEEEPYGYQERRVQIVASHPQFDPRTFEYDLALLRFYEPVIFQPNIIPVCVPDSDENFIGRTAYVTGWGRLYEDGPLPSVLQEVTVPVIENSICEAMYRRAGYIEHIPHIFICAGWKNGGFDSCEGDSGGPMVIQRHDKRFQLAGVISWGIGCAEPNQPGVYTRISEFRDWINQILQF
ncbi:serine proteinase stubble [Phlebotomus papatasi]|uniref:serine proteinase stubble n=1 Tax=Phlebotomus papatasi TaxID=29031 RepID=UPI00248416D0|nr:serine proteinase stubble [Phlebotomus papatasi]